MSEELAKFKADLEAYLGESVGLTDAELEVYYQAAIWRAALAYRKSQMPVRPW